jgi:rhamnose transport system permease protein
VYGRLLYATGNNRRATYLSGHSIKVTIASTYAIGGLTSGVAALVYIGQYQSARADNVANILLFVVACVALGGFSISGGKGRVIGIILSILLLGTIQNGMGLANIQGPVQTLVIGLILIAAILVPTVLRALGGLRFRGKDLAEKPSAGSK